MSVVLIIDDHPAIAEGLRSILEVELDISRIQVAESAEAAIGLAAENCWSLIVCDLSLPGRSGPELIAELARLAPGARILVHTVHSEKQFGVRCLRAGAHGYVTKDRPIEEFIAAVRTVMAGKRYVSPDLAAELIQALEGPRHPHEVLSDRELQVLRLLGRGLTAQEVAAELHINSKTVSTYRTRILEKLNLRTTGELIRFAIQNDLI